MRKPDEIRHHIAQIREKLKTPKHSISKKQQELAKLKESHAKLIESTIGRQRMPKSLEKQRASLVTLTMEIDGLQSAKTNLETKLTQLQTELARAELYNRVQDYRQAEEKLQEMAQAVVSEIRELNVKISSCKASITEFLAQSANPVEIIRVLVSAPALSGLSLPKFFKGEIADMTPGENDAFFQAIAQRYREILHNLPKIESVEDSWVMSSDRLGLVSSSANGLIPRHMKYVAPEASPPPAQRTSHAIHIHPKDLVPSDSGSGRPVKNAPPSILIRVRGVLLQCRAPHFFH